MTEFQEMETDIAIVGGGSAGISAAVSAAEFDADILVCEHGQPASSRASGFNAVESREDGSALFYQDTMISGAEICNPLLVAELSAFSRDIVSFMRNLGVDIRDSGNLGTRLSGGSSVPRTLFSEGEQLGSWLLKELTRHACEKGVKLANCRIYDAQKEGNTFHLEGISDDGESIRIRAKALVLATGGLGALYGYTTNYPSSVGDGYRMALELGATLVDMEFTQFEPFIMLGPGPCRGRGVPINLVADGGRITNSMGKAFIPPAPKGIRSYTKDMLARMIFTEVLEGRGSPAGGVFCDVTKGAHLIGKYPGFEQTCIKAKVDPRASHLEICPAYHCMMGGITIDRGGTTAVEGLYAAGEVAGGVHGANRLGSNGMTDALCFGALAGRNAGRYLMDRKHDALSRIQKSAPSRTNGKKPDQLPSIKKRLQEVMLQKAGLVRNEQRLLDAASETGKLKQELTSMENSLPRWDFLGMKGLLDLGWLISLTALRRRESRGVHFRSDYPSRRDPLYRGSFAVRKHRNTYQFGFIQRESGVNWE